MSDDCTHPRRAVVLRRNPEKKGPNWSVQYDEERNLCTGIPTHHRATAAVFQTHPPASPVLSWDDSVLVFS